MMSLVPGSTPGLVARPDSSADRAPILFRLSPCRHDFGDPFHRGLSPPLFPTNNTSTFMTAALTHQSIHVTGEATGFLPAPGSRGKPISVLGTAAIRETFDARCLEQAMNSRGAPGVTD